MALLALEPVTILNLLHDVPVWKFLITYDYIIRLRPSEENLTLAKTIIYKQLRTIFYVIRGF